MKAIAIVPGTKTVHFVDRPEPSISRPDEIKLRVLQVGICGTDREEISGGRAEAPEGAQELIIGHEMIGQVVAVGEQVTRVQPGDLAVFTVRRGCGNCLPCLMNRSDMCLTGEYRERGIKGIDGYQAEYVVDTEPYIVRVPRELKDIGVLCEPMSVVVKAIDEAVRLQMTRLPSAPSTPDWLYGRRCLVSGLGPVGLLGALVLRLHNAEVHGLDIVDADSARPQWLSGIGGHYIDGRQVAADKIQDTVGAMDFIFEATGVPKLAFNLIDALGRNGVYVLVGIPGNDGTISLPAAELMQRIVLSNQVMIGSVNAARGHFQMAIDYLLQAHPRWGAFINRLIIAHYPYADYEKALFAHDPNEIKVAVDYE